MAPPDRKEAGLGVKLAWFAGLWLLGVGVISVVGLLIKAVL